MSLRVMLDNLHLNNVGHLSSFHISINYEGNRETMGMANNKKRPYSVALGTKVNGRVLSAHSIKHCMSDYWVLIPSQSQWLNLTKEASSGTMTRGGVIPMFSHLKISPFILCWLQLGLCLAARNICVSHLCGGNGERR